MKELNPKALERIGKTEADFLPSETPPTEEIAELKASNAELREALDALLRGEHNE